MRLLIVLSRIPYPLEKGDKLRAYHQIKSLSQKHQIILCCLTTESETRVAKEKLAEFCTHIYFIKLPKWRVWLSTLKGLFSSLPLQVHYFYHPKAQKKVDSIIETHIPNHIFCQLIRVSEYVKKYSFIPKTLDYMDCLSQGMGRRAKRSNSPIKLLYNLEHKRLLNYERNISHFFENAVVISEQDKKELKLPENPEVISNGVDTTFFTDKYPKKKIYDMVFVGNLSYEPNIQSAVYIVKKILPILHKQRPTLKLLISGANPVKKVRDLASNSVNVKGWVQDIRKAYASGKVFVAPLELGSGLQNKLLEAMSMGLPAVTSALANGSLNAMPNQDILIGHTPDEYAEHILNLLNDPDLYSQISNSGKKYIQQSYSWQQTGEQLNTLLHNTEYP